MEIHVWAALLVNIIVIRSSIVRGEPRIHEKPEAVYIIIYLCMILHSNDSMRMLRHRVVDRLLWLIKVVINAVEGRIVAVQC